MWSIILGAAVAAVAVLAFYFVATAGRIARPTRGDPIAGDATKAALLVIDLQEDFTRSDGANAYDPVERDRAIARINDLVAAADMAGEPVAFVRQEHQGRAVRLVASLLLGGAGNPGRPGACLDGDVDADGRPVFVKHVADAFSDPALDAWLRERKVGRLTLCGLDLAHCVRGTAIGARNRGYLVTVDLAGSLAAREKPAARAIDEMEAAGIVIRGHGADGRASPPRPERMGGPASP